MYIHVLNSEENDLCYMYVCTFVRGVQTLAIIKRSTSGELHVHVLGTSECVFVCRCPVASATLAFSAQQEVILTVGWSQAHNRKSS